MSTPPIVGGYSFYLNVVVIDGGAAGQPRDEPELNVERTIDFETTAPDSPSASDPVVEEVEQKDQAVVSAPDTRNKLMLDGRSFVDSISSSITKRAAAFVAEEKQKKTPDPKRLVQDGQRFMNVMKSSISKTSSNISNRATAFVASKTMVSRAEKAVVECIPMVTEEIGVEMNISKRFQQGPVFVLEVDMKGCDLLELLEKVLGEESAQHYRNVRQGLDFLSMTDSMTAFDKEILPEVRKGLMAKMSEIVPEKMKLKKGNADLEIQCVALEDAEEAKWLYNFLEFMEQMK
jgi:hypothetical protein